VKWFGSSVNTVGDGGRRLFEPRRTLGPWAGRLDGGDRGRRTLAHALRAAGAHSQQPFNHSSGLPVACHGNGGLLARPSSAPGLRPWPPRQLADGQCPGRGFGTALLVCSWGSTAH
jgi:hypothetical protein